MRDRERQASGPLRWRKQAVTLRTNSRPPFPPVIVSEATRQTVNRPRTLRRQIMKESNENSSQEPERGSVEAGEVLAAMEKTVEAAGALGVEIERAKRLLRETEKLVDRPLLSEPEQASNGRTDNGRR